MDALHIQQAVLGGYDWGARSADIVAALWPERVKALVSVSGYLIGNQAAGQQPLPPKTLPLVYPPSRWKAMPTAHRTRQPRIMPSVSLALTRSG